MADVVVLLATYFRAAIDTTSLRNAVIEPLLADVILLLTHDNETDVASSTISEKISGLKPIARLAFEAQKSTHELGLILEASPSWPRLLAAYTMRGICSSKRTSTAGYSCATKRIGSSGNSFLAPLIGHHSLNVLRQLYMQSRVFALLREHERGARGGREYQAVVWTRTEFRWLRPHPSLALLEAPLRCVWVPLEEDYGGLNDRHALMPRAAARGYLGRWDALLDDSIFQVLPCRANGTTCAESSERYLAETLRYHRLPVCRFPPMAHLVCCVNDRLNCFKLGCYGPLAVKADVRPLEAPLVQSLRLLGHDMTFEPRKSITTTGFVSLTNRSDNIRLMRLSDTSGKYHQELASAVFHTAASLWPGARLVRREGLKFPHGGAYAFSEPADILMVDLPSVTSLSLIAHFHRLAYTKVTERGSELSWTVLSVAGKWHGKWAAQLRPSHNHYNVSHNHS